MEQGIQSTGEEKTILWDAKNDYFGKEQDELILSVNAYDTFQNRSIDNFSNTFSVDTKAPLGLDNFVSAGSNLNEIIYSWTPVTLEKNFSHYEIWYGEDIESVEERVEPASLWSIEDDDKLEIMGTASTIITDLEEGTIYFAKIWAVDKYGNETDSSVDETITIERPFSPILDQPESPVNTNIVEITGIAPVDTTIEIYLNNELVEELNTDELGKFSVELEIEEGNNEIYVIAIDELENRSDPSTTISVEYIIEIEEIDEQEITEDEDDITDEVEDDETETIDTPITDEDSEIEIVEEEIEDITTDITTQPTVPEEETEDTSEIFVNITEEIIEDISIARESPILQRPEVLGASSTGLDNVIRFNGTGIPNSEIVVFIHSNQAIVYRTQIDSDGHWELEHSQNEIQLESGDHQIYALTLDSESQVKSAVSDVLEFNVESNTIAVILSYFDLTTTILTIVITTLAIVVFMLGRKSNKQLLKQN